MREQPDPAAVAFLLDEGRRLIAVHGHVKNALGSPERGFCAVGALVHAMDSRPLVLGVDYYDACTRLERAAGARNVVDWNNAPERSREDVLAAFDAALVASPVAA